MMTSRPHDALFKSVFGDPSHAADELRFVVGPELSAAIEWETLQLEPGEFVDESLADSHSDLLFSARAGGRTALVYLLFDHQSSPDSRMALRLFGYMHEIWRRWCEREPTAAYLPFIVPVVLSHAEGGWTAARRFPRSRCG